MNVFVHLIPFLYRQFVHRLSQVRIGRPLVHHTDGTNVVIFRRHRRYTPDMYRLRCRRRKNPGLRWQPNRILRPSFLFWSLGMFLLLLWQNISMPLVLLVVAWVSYAVLWILRELG